MTDVSRVNKIAIYGAGVIGGGTAENAQKTVDGSSVQMSDQTKNISFCPVPGCDGIMALKAETVTGSSALLQTRTVWVCPVCGFVYSGAKPMPIWETEPSDGGDAR